MNANFFITLVCAFFTIISGGIAFVSAKKSEKIISLVLAVLAILVALVLNIFPRGDSSEHMQTDSTSITSTVADNSSNTEETQTGSTGISPTKTGESNDTEIEKEGFYGIWVFGSQNYQEAQEKLVEVQTNEFSNAEIITTTDWENLNSATWYVITTGRYENEDEAKADLPYVQSFYSDAYVKKTGGYKGSN